MFFGLCSFSVNDVVNHFNWVVVEGDEYFSRWDNSWFSAVFIDEIGNARLSRLLIVDIFHVLGACAFQLRYTSVCVGLR